MDDARFELVPFDELEVFIRRSCGGIFHLLCDVFQETGPARCGAESGYIVCSHLDALIRGEEETAAWDMMDVVEIICGSDGDEIGRGLVRVESEHYHNELQDKDNTQNCDPKF